MSLVTIQYKGRSYSYGADAYHVGCWYPTTGRNAYITVPITLSSQLMRAAREQGVNPEIFSVKKPKKIPGERKSRSKKLQSNKLKKSEFSVSLSSMIKKIRSGEMEEHSSSE